MTRTITTLFIILYLASSYMLYEQWKIERLFDSAIVGLIQQGVGDE